jgi:hypothetical protein
MPKTYCNKSNTDNPPKTSHHNIVSTQICSHSCNLTTTDFMFVSRTVGQLYSPTKNNILCSSHLVFLIKIQYFYELHYCILLFQDGTHRWCYCYTRLRSLHSHHTENAIYGVSDFCSFTQHDFPNDFNKGWSIHVKVISRSNTHMYMCIYTHTQYASQYKLVFL